ncbi:hypothetical protein FTW19_01590 [Terriglobus albidus]|uniref:Uncharacterized protein n=1 Tax=Terriglobus albidus TaxID=1592106 RepID=A0A5B9E4U4_9BACT|nr:hypothetical protein [Terriglobus albidus]QEE26809.1 hypothetical protein FTW19_01590 [Terriglobus albidus]
MTLKRVQNAIQFLASLRSGSITGAHDPAQVMAFDEDALVGYAASCGYEVDAASIAEAFRARMLVREAERRKAVK